jgi:4'-phosphopantetheinyl transferase
VRWRAVDSPPPLAPGDLHLWRIATGEGGAPVGACLDLLGGRQRERAQRMTHAAARDRYVRSQAGLRRILALYLGVRPGFVHYRYGPVGKPGLAGACAWLEFNLTTTGDLALVGVSRGLALGVDCEWIRPRRDLDGIARRMFGPERAEALAAMQGHERLAAFCHAWTALEADAKWDGRGLFRQRPAAAPVPAIAHLIPEPGYVAAVARAALPPTAEWATLELAL